jgi:mRNA-degrading endonuclease toxin of MazEF toxin-antitoxin module
VSPTRLPQLGSVVWAELADANGNRKVRPAVVVTPTADIVAGRPLRVVAVTTRLSTPLPNDHVLLPWDPRGRARSGLRRRCAAVATWQAEIVVGDVRQVVGHLPPAVIGELLAKIAASLPPPAEDGSPAAGATASPPDSPLAAFPPTDVGDRQEDQGDGKGGS